MERPSISAKYCYLDFSRALIKHNTRKHMYIMPAMCWSLIINSHAALDMLYYTERLSCCSEPKLGHQFHCVILHAVIRIGLKLRLDH